MQVAAYDRYGPPSVLSLREIPQPRAGRGEVVVKVHAAALNPKDALTRAGKFALLSGRRFPMVPGNDVAGTVAEVGADVNDFRIGDAVYGMSNRFCGACCAEYVVMPIGELAPKPASLGFVAAAAVPLAALTALQALRDCGHVVAGSEVCIHGASGGVGTFAVQIAKALGAHVTALCSQANREFVHGLGADEVIDYRCAPPPSLAQKFDCFFDVFGNQSYAVIKPRLRWRGTYVSTVPKMRNFIDHGRTFVSPLRRARMVIVRSIVQDLEQLSRWIGEGRLKPIIATVLPLSDIRQAHELIETRRTKGKIVLEITGSD
jgi:NADPH:quinone reductase-like Zn-dependent oxidoreductase